MLLNTTIKKFKSELLDINFDAIYDKALLDNEYSYHQLLETTQMCLYVNDHHKNEHAVGHLVRMLECIRMARHDLGEDRVPLSKPTLLHVIASLEKYSKCEGGDSPPKFMFN